MLRKGALCIKEYASESLHDRIDSRGAVREFLSIAWRAPLIVGQVSVTSLALSHQKGTISQLFVSHDCRLSVAAAKLAH